jgi:hypothetical protein
MLSAEQRVGEDGRLHLSAALKRQTGLFLQKAESHTDRDVAGPLLVM